jgi:phage-related protein
MDLELWRQGFIRFWFFMIGRQIVLCHAMRNKGQGMPGRELDIARARMGDW